MSGDLRVRMLFEANAQAARAETLSLKDATQQLSQGVSAAGRAAAGTAPQLTAMGGATKATAADILRTVSTTGELNSINQILRASINPLVAEYQSLQGSMRDIAMLEELGAINGREAALAHDVLARDANKLMAAMEAAGTSIDGTALSMTRQETAAQSLINQITGVSRATDSTIADQLRHGAALDAPRARYNPLFAASRQYEIELREIAEAERLGAISAMEAAAARTRASAALAPVPNQLRQVGASSQTAAAYAGQLTFQLNDIGMMMAMGQSPFMLMVQQGPQVTQVFDQMRRSGMAIGPAIAGAFTSMLNPVSLATMAVIGIGAAAVQWFSQAEQKSKTLSDAIGELGSNVSSYESAVQRALTPMWQLRKEWGDQAEAVRALYNAQLELSKLQALKSMQDALKSVKTEFEGLTDQLTAFDVLRSQQAAGDDITFAMRRGLKELREEFGLTEEQAREAQAAFAEVNASLLKGPEEQAVALERAVATLKAMRDTSGQIPPKILETAIKFAEAALAARGLKKPIEESNDAARSLAGVDMASGIAAASAEARALAANLGISLDLARALTGEATATAKPRIGFGLPGVGDPVIGGAPGLTFGDNPGGGVTRDGMPIVRTTVPTASSGRGRGGGGGGAAEERDALKELIEAQERQIEVLHTTDPVQREILKNHEALKDATAGEKAEVEALIAERQRLEEIRDRIDEIGKTGEDAFKGLLSGAHSFGDALSMVLMKLADMAASDAWDILWGGGKGGGGNGGGGIWGVIADWAGGFGKKADGGRIAGPGGPREDNILTWTSAGEYVVNARATAAHLPLIEAINAGASPGQLMAIIGGQRLAGFADGGRIGASAPADWRTGLSRPADSSPDRGEARLRIYFDKDLNLRGEIEQISGRVATDVMIDGISTFSSEILPDRVQQIDANPRLKG